MKSPDDHNGPARIDPTKWKSPRVPIVKIAHGGTGWSQAQCSCGWYSDPCVRDKVLNARIQKHLDRRHDGRGVRL